MQMHVIREPTSVKHLKSVRLMSLVVGGIFSGRKRFMLKKEHLHAYNNRSASHICNSKSLSGWVVTLIMLTLKISMAVNVDMPERINLARATLEFIYSLLPAFSRASISSRAITYVFQQLLKCLSLC